MPLPLEKSIYCYYCATIEVLWDYWSFGFRNLIGPAYEEQEHKDYCDWDSGEEEKECNIVNEWDGQRRWISCCFVVTVRWNYSAFLHAFFVFLLSSGQQTNDPASKHGVDRCCTRTEVCDISGKDSEVKWKCDKSDLFLLWVPTKEPLPRSSSSVVVDIWQHFDVSGMFVAEIRSLTDQSSQ